MTRRRRGDGVDHACGGRVDDRAPRTIPPATSRRFGGRVAGRVPFPHRCRVAAQPATLAARLEAPPPEPHRVGLARPGGWHGAGLPGWSQANQDVVVDMLLSELRNGFFIEAGAYDGEEFSNTLFFETARNWTGLLVEANPHYARRVRSRRRAVSLLAGGLSTTGEQTSFPFVLAGPRGGIVSTMDKADMDFTRKRIGKKIMWANGAPEGGQLGRTIAVLVVARGRGLGAASPISSPGVPPEAPGVPLNNKTINKF